MSSLGTACTSCGANISVDPQYGVAECPYCGSVYSDPAVTAAQRRAYALAQQKTKDAQRVDLGNYEKQYKKKRKGGLFQRLIIASISIIVLLVIAYIGVSNGKNDASTQNTGIGNTAMPSVGTNPENAVANVSTNTVDTGLAIPNNTVASSDSDSQPETALAPDVAERSATVLIDRYFADWNQSGNLGIPAMLASYAETVNFYGTPTPLSEVARQKWAFAREWPERNYEIRPNSVSASCTADICVVKGIADFRAANPETGRNSSGISEFETGVQNNKIVFESAKVLSRGSNE